MPHLTATTACSLVVSGETVQIPERIYFRPESYRRVGLTEAQSDMIDCLHTRNYDGFVRERAFRNLSQLNESWTIPFVYRLVGDYVVEILDALYERRHKLDRRAYNRFACDNPRFRTTTTSRVISYWNAYYRSAIPDRPDYVGFRLLAHLENG